MSSGSHGLSEPNQSPAPPLPPHKSSKAQPTKPKPQPQLIYLCTYLPTHQLYRFSTLNQLLARPGPSPLLPHSPFSPFPFSLFFSLPFPPSFLFSSSLSAPLPFPPFPLSHSQAADLGIVWGGLGGREEGREGEREGSYREGRDRFEREEWEGGRKGGRGMCGWTLWPENTAGVGWWGR